MATLTVSLTEWTDTVYGLVKTAAIVGGGLIALYEYRRFRRYSPKIEFNVDFVMHRISEQSRMRLLDIAITVRNMSQVRNYFSIIEVGVKSPRAEDIQAALRDGKRLRFGHELISKHNIVANPKDPWWVDGGVTQVFPCPVVIEEQHDLGFLQVNAEFKYHRDKAGKKVTAYHQASCVKPTKKPEQ